MHVRCFYVCWSRDPLRGVPDCRFAQQGLTKDVAGKWHGCGSLEHMRWAAAHCKHPLRLCFLLSSAIIPFMVKQVSSTHLVL